MLVLLIGLNSHKNFISVVIALVHFYFLTSTNFNGSKILWDDTVTHRGVFDLPFFASSDLTADLAATTTILCFKFYQYHGFDQQNIPSKKIQEYHTTPTVLSRITTNHL